MEVSVLRSEGGFVHSIFTHSALLSSENNHGQAGNNQDTLRFIKEK